MPPRADRRRRQRGSRERPQEAAESQVSPPPLVRRTEIALVGLVGISVVLIVLFVVLVGGGGGEGSDATQPTAATPAASPGGRTPTGPEQQALEVLARQSIEVLPRGQWPSLYDSFTAAFQQRCPRERFDELGRTSAQSLGTDVTRLRFVRLERVSVQGDSAQGVIVGMIEGQAEYSVEAGFQKEDGAWKLAPAPNTQGCSAFNRLSG